MVTELLFTLLIALGVVGIFSVGFRRPGPWGIVWFFLLVFLGAWAFGAWAEPVGPVAWGVAWAPILVAAVLIALIVAAVPPTGTRATGAPEAEARSRAVPPVGTFFWLLIIVLLVIVALSYAY